MSRRPITNQPTSAAHKLLLFAAALATSISLGTMPLASQAHGDAATERKIVKRVEPDYPETLKRLYIGGVVRVEAVVAPSGAVSETQLLGGNPILGQSAMKA